MKYIVPQDKLLNIMNSYLDDKLVGGVSKVDNYIIIFYYDDANDDSEVLMEFDSYDGRLYVNKSFIETFGKLFPFVNSQSFIKKWFETKFGVTIEYVA
jgi:hypothetical protein